MGYLFLSVSLLAGVTKGYCGKRTGGYTETPRAAVGANVLRMSLCMVIGFFMVLAQGGITTLRVELSTLLYALLSGASTAIFAVTWLLSVRRGAYMLVDVFLMCGVLIPVLGSTVLLHESITPLDIAGLALLLVAVFIMCAYNNSVKAKLTPLSLLLLLICGASSGLTDFSQKLFTKEQTADTLAAFSFYTYVFAAVLLLLYFLITTKRATSPSAEELSPAPNTPVAHRKRILIYISVMALCMFAASYFQTLAAQHLSATQLYPLSRGLALVLSALMAALLFKEKLTLRCVVGMLLAFAALLMLNL